MGATVRAFDPVGMKLARIETPDIQYSGDPYECAYGAGALVIVTEWEQFRALYLDRLKREMAGPVIVDLRNFYDPNELKERGFLYRSIGRRLEAYTQGSLSVDPDIPSIPGSGREHYSRHNAVAGQNSASAFPRTL
jgi:hypothetical protein